MTCARGAPSLCLGLQGTEVGRGNLGVSWASTVWAAKHPRSEHTLSTFRIRVTKVLHSSRQTRTFTHFSKYSQIRPHKLHLNMKFSNICTSVNSKRVSEHNTTQSNSMRGYVYILTRSIKQLFPPTSGKNPKLVHLYETNLNSIISKPNEIINLTAITRKDIWTYRNCANSKYFGRLGCTFQNVINRGWTKTRQLITIILMHIL